MPRILRCVSVALLLLSLGLFLLAAETGTKVILGKEARVGLSIDSLTHDLGVVRPGSEALVRYRLSNRGSVPLVIVGASESCILTGCLGVVDQLPTTIPPGRSVEFKVLFRARQPGHFRNSVTIYTTGSGEAGTPLTVSALVQKQP